MRFYKYIEKFREPPENSRKWGVRIGLLVLIVMGVMNLEVVKDKRVMRNIPVTPKVDHKLLQGSTLSIIRSIPHEEDYGDIQIEYVPIKQTCRPPSQTLLKTSINKCWYSKPFHNGLQAEFRQNVGENEEVVCAPKLIIIGAQRSGTADLAEWLAEAKTVSYPINQEMDLAACPVEHFEERWRLNFKEDMEIQDKMKEDYVLVDVQPHLLFQTTNEGTTMETRIRTLLVRSGMQQMEVIASKDTRYILILRNPVSRVISQLNDWSHKGYLQVELTQQYMHQVVSKQILKLSACFRAYGPKGCIFMADTKEGNLDTLLMWGLYSEYVEEALKFINKDQLVALTLEYYQNREYHAVQKISKRLQIGMQSGYKMLNLTNSKVNHREPGYIIPWKTTTNLLAHFYKTFNYKLALLLDDKQFCFSMCR